jgi:hypothetical protein
MLPSSLVTLLLAADSPVDQVVEAMGAGYRGQHAGHSAWSIVTICAASVVTIVGLWGLLRLYNWWRSSRQNSPKWLFDELCRAHQVAGTERRLLWTAALEQHPENPALVFVEPDSLRPPKLKFRRRLESDRLAAVAKRLFGELSVPHDPSPAQGKTKPAATPLRNAGPTTAIDVRKM